MKKILLILAFSNTLTSELILEITQGTEDPYRVAILKFEGDEKVSNDIDKIIRNNLKRSGEFNLFANESEESTTWAVNRINVGFQSAIAPLRFRVGYEWVTGQQSIIFEGVKANVGVYF